MTIADKLYLNSLHNVTFSFYENVRPEIMDMLYQFYKWDFVLMGYSKLSNPNFPYLDFNQDFEKEFGPLNAIADESSTEPSEVTKPHGR